jgi:nucleotide-binding universal stress UspA family protein
MSNDKIQTVLIGTSLNEPSDAVVRAGAELARAAGANVHLLHAYAQQVAYGGAPYMPEVSIEETLHAEREALRQRMKDQAGRAGVRAADLAEMALEPGPPHRTLIAAAKRTGADLVVVGSAESPRLAKVFGSTADRVVRKAVCPVLLVRGEPVLPPRRVLVPVDLSRLSGEALRDGLEILSRIGAGATATVEALFILTDAERRAFIDVSGKDGADAERAAWRDLESFLALYVAGTDWTVVPRLATGPVGATILARVEEWQPDLVILATHGRGGFERLMLGSVAERMMREVPGSVLVIPPAAAREEAPVEVKEETHAVVHG